jgi:bidirectional [NiFe] hydrogenase diaphorase subunit
MVKITVDNKEIEAAEGGNLLQTCLDNGIYIPNLCYINGQKSPPASCRLCFVEIEGDEGPLPSCTVNVRDGMVVRTDTPPIRRLQRSALRLLLSTHHIDCGHCPANKKCELQRAAKKLDVRLKSEEQFMRLKEVEVDDTHPFFNYYPNRCVLCGKCVYICQKKHHKPLLTFAKRGLDTVITFYRDEGVSNLPCKECLACVEICPVCAITVKSDSSPS